MEKVEECDRGQGRETAQHAVDYASIVALRAMWTGPPSLYESVFILLRHSPEQSMPKTGPADGPGEEEPNYRDIIGPCVAPR
jgi:hypothetical protein